jgi:hypothetical protein
VATDDAPLTLARVWREMTAEQRAAAARAFWLDEESLAQQAEAVAHLARHLRFRPQSVLSLSVDRKVRQLAMLPKPSDAVVGRALVVYHLEQQRPMLASFLDQLGIAHEEGVIADAPAPSPSAERMSEAAAALAAIYPIDDVRLYLRTLAVQDPGTWGALRPVSESLVSSPS